MINRREFLERTGAALAFGAFGVRSPGVPAPPAPRPESLSRIGVELYTVRHLMDESVERTLAQVARIGYKEVEFAGYFRKTPLEIRAILDANGLTSPSAHSADLPSIRNGFARVLEAATIIGHTTVICASLPSAEETVDGYKRAAREFNQAGEAAAQAGLAFGFHNHEEEFKPLGSTNGYDVLLAECDPKLVKMQLDLFWTVKGGKDPLAYFAKYPGRFTSVHVKDMAADGAMVDVGAGRLPFAKYFAQSKEAGIRHYFVEHDQPPDPMASIAASYKYLSGLTF